jgi:hypothetical protein
MGYTHALLPNATKQANSHKISFFLYKYYNKIGSSHDLGSKSDFGAARALVPSFHGSSKPHGRVTIVNEQYLLMFTQHIQR